MISYVVPLFKNGETIGIVGMDINFKVFTDIVNQIKPYENSYGSLLNANENFLIDPVFKQQDNLAAMNKSLSEALHKQELGVNAAVVDNEERIVSFAKLSNGHTLLISSTKQDLYKDVDQLTKLNAAVLVGVILLAVITALLLGNKFTKPIQVLIADMRKVKEGDFTIQTRIKNKDEIGEIGSNFNRMVQELGSLAKNIRVVSEKMNSSSSSLASVSQEISAASEQVTASVEEIAEGNKAQSVSIENSSEISLQLSNQCKALYSNTNDILTGMQEMNLNNQESLQLIKGLNEINAKNNEAVDHIEKEILDLNEKNKNIGQILEQINGVAEQTNLLALNASIESARAGEAGKGFAVVASEIRKLAEQSKQSTEDIRNIILTVQEDSKSAVDAMQIVKARGIEQSESVIKVSEAFQLISASIHQINDKLTRSNDGITRLTTDAERLADEVEGISTISEETAASSEQVAVTMQSQAKDLETVVSAIDDLQQLAETLNELIKKFKID
jgi:methyl-accepting chemotaxis protein